MRRFDAGVGARILVETCLNIRAQDDVLVVTDTNLVDLAELLATVAGERGAEVAILTMAPRDAPGIEPPGPVAEAMKAADAIMMLTTFTLAPTRARAEAQYAGARILSLGGYNYNTLLSDALKADFPAIRPTVEYAARRLTEADAARVTTKIGTEVMMRLGNREAHALHNICHDPGTMGSPPDVEAYVAPLEDTAEGILFIDGAINLPEFGLVREPIKLTFKEGRVVGIDGGDESERLKGLLDSYEDPEMYRLSEMGVGLNPRARLVGNPLIDEGAQGTAHIALGLNYTYGGTIREAKTHIDCIFRKPTIELDGEPLIIEGDLIKKK
ncbi:MAG: aminopeptidase [Candidatus Bathyarchaeia archaeon]